MAENERKRKRVLAGEESEELSDINDPGKEKPMEGLKAPKPKKQKSNKVEGAESIEPVAKKTHTSRTAEQIEARRREKAEKKREKSNSKSEKKQAKVHAKQSEEPAAAEEDAGDESGHEDNQPDNQAEYPSLKIDADFDPDDMERVDVSGLVDEEVQSSQLSASPEPHQRGDSPSSSLPSPSSSSSIVPLLSSEEIEKQIKQTKSDKSKLPKIDQDALKARLTAKIEALRAARKADGIDGKPAKNRQELMEARRRKEEERKQRKKEMRKLAKEEEDKLKAEAELARLRGSGSPLTPDMFSPARSPERYNFSFGKISFGDGQQVDSTGSGLQDIKKKKGPSDTKTALEAAKKKEARISGLDETKRADIAQKDAWLNAKKRAHGERVRDDVSLLKKTLKRKEKAKAKSEKDWNTRIEGVKKGQEIRQKKREENLRKRKEEKGTKKGKHSKVVKKKARPGFEGKFGQK